LVRNKPRPWHSPRLMAGNKIDTMHIWKGFVFQVRLMFEYKQLGRCTLNDKYIISSIYKKKIDKHVTQERTYGRRVDCNNVCSDIADRFWMWLQWTHLTYLCSFRLAACCLLRAKCDALSTPQHTFTDGPVFGWQVRLIWRSVLNYCTLKPEKNCPISLYMFL
jgi:hypothetical protein